MIDVLRRMPSARGSPEALTDTSSRIGKPVSDRDNLASRNSAMDRCFSASCTTRRSGWFFTRRLLTKSSPLAALSVRAKRVAIRKRALEDARSTATSVGSGSYSPRPCRSDAPELGEAAVSAGVNRRLSACRGADAKACSFAERLMATTLRSPCARARSRESPDGLFFSSAESESSRRSRKPSRPPRPRHQIHQVVVQTFVLRRAAKIIAESHGNDGCRTLRVAVDAERKSAPAGAGPRRARVPAPAKACAEFHLRRDLEVARFNSRAPACCAQCAAFLLS